MILSLVGDGVVTTDSNGISTSPNSVVEDLTGWKSRDALLGHVADLLEIKPSKVK